MTMASVEHVDVLIVGAGISGIGAAYYLQKHQPHKTYAILEARGAAGGTWDLFRYPGIRSDSDLHTFSYEFKPWENEKAIAGADAIMAYLRETMAENRIDDKIRFHHKVISAAWSSDDAQWLVEVERADTGERSEISCGWFFCASGYYRYDAGFTPEFPGRKRFAGQIIHPQHWPEDLDYSGKRVVIIGSGATAVTLVPAMADSAAHVTMLQRSPTYIVPVPSKDRIANTLPKLVGRKRAYAITRQKNVAKQAAIYRLCKSYPSAARRLIRHLNAKQLPKGYPVDEHFKPAYNPWDQRLCAVPDADMFAPIRHGRASVVTDKIETFTERGIKLRSGRELEADIIVTATGLNLLAFGAITLTVDGIRVNVPERGRVQGPDAQRRPEFRVLVRLPELQLLVDAQGRAGVRALLPTAGLHGRARLHEVLPGSHGSEHEDPAAAWRGRRLRQAVDRQVPPSGRSRSVADADGLPLRRQNAVRRARRRHPPALRYRRRATASG
jgi:monooxygenase